MKRVPRNQSPAPHISIPPHILEHHQHIEIHVDYFYVNCLPYPHKKLSNINFLTVKTGKNRTEIIFETGLVHVINTHEEINFKVTMVHGDNEFDLGNVKKAIQPEIVHIKFREGNNGIVER